LNAKLWANIESSVFQKHFMHLHLILL
jgi:hypothetical protein